MDGGLLSKVKILKRECLSIIIFGRRLIIDSGIKYQSKEDVAAHTKPNYEKQLQNLAEKLKAPEDLFNKSKEEANQIYTREIGLQGKQIETLTS